METHKAEIQSTDFKPWDMELRQYLVLMHLSQFAGYVLFLAGFVLPIFMWLSFNDKNRLINEHGKNIVNFVISYFIYLCVFGVLSFALIGIPFLIIIVLVGIIFPIIGAIKAANGEIYKYPATIKFLK